MANKFYYDRSGFRRAVNKGLISALDSVGLIIEATAKRKMRKGGRVKIGKKTKSVPSTPPDPPHVQTGNLRSSITYAVDNQAGSVVVGAVAVYGKIHEHGGLVDVKPHTRVVTKVFGRKVKPTTQHVSGHSSLYPKRPFMAPSIEEARPKILKKFLDRLKK